jgi:hypothetical protein
MAVTLMEASKLALGRGDVLNATVMELYARNSDVLRTIMFENIQGNALLFNREQTLPNVGFRKLNSGYTEGTGTFDKVSEPLVIAGGDLDVDKFFVDTMGGDQRAIQEAAKVKALSLAWTKTFVKGDVSSSPEEFDGIQVRVESDYTVDAGSTSGGDALSLAKLDELIDTCDQPTHLLMNKAMRRRLSAAARSATVGGYITYDLDEFGRRVSRYNDLPIILADKDNTNTDILPFTEANPGGGGAASTSIYAISFMEDGVIGLQNGDMDVRDLGELESKPVLRTRVEWYTTIAVMRKNSIARLQGIKNAAVTA